MPISWVHFSESPDPTPYLEGGEVLLTTGLVMPKDQPDEIHRSFASRLIDAGVRGIGFGIGVQHDSIPQWLVYQCEATGLALFSVPLKTPFIAISKTIARGISDDTHQNFARMYSNQQRLMRSVKSLDPVSTIVSRLAELIGGWVALLNPVGSIISSSHHVLPVEVGALGDALAFSVLGEAKFTVAKGYDIAIFHVASPTKQTLGYLVAGRKGEKGTIDHPLVAEAASLLSLAVNGTADSNRSLNHLRSTMTRLCLEGESQSVRRFADDVWSGLPVQPLVALRIIGQQDALEDAGRLFEPFRRTVAKNDNRVVFGIVDGDMWAIVSQSNAAMWTQQLTRTGRLTVGQSSGATWIDMPRARHEAYQAGAEALTSGKALVQYGDGEGGATLEGVVEPSLMRAFADLKLAPIANLTFDLSTGPHTKAGTARTTEAAPATESSSDETDSGTQVRAIDVLWAWLQSRGRTEEAARMSGMHRHTLTKYLGVIGKELGADLNDPGTTAELWYACRFSRSGGTLK
ncbi:PucR family transcriptional regulator [Bifidobacteriaceae bacterium MCC02031]|nr:PucR family transcriptional regulator [Bifidobacteriaceae bacterium MCC02031]